MLANSHYYSQQGICILECRFDIVRKPRRHHPAVTLKQLTFLREIARQSLNMSKAAAALYTSQPGVSRQIQLLEEELGVPILVRRKNRTLGYTDAGKAILDAAQRLLNEAESIRAIAGSPSSPRTFMRVTRCSTRCRPSSPAIPTSN
jgi:DNA-binding transcriptional LysR family regulator